MTRPRQRYHVLIDHQVVASAGTWKAICRAGMARVRASGTAGVLLRSPSGACYGREAVGDGWQWVRLTGDKLAALPVALGGEGRGAAAPATLDQDQGFVVKTPSDAGGEP